MRAGSVTDKSSVGDASPEAREHGMSVQLNVADVNFLGDSFTFIDCPGSIEFQHEAAVALTACDAAVVVSEPDRSMQRSDSRRPMRLRPAGVSVSIRIVRRPAGR